MLKLKFISHSLHGGYTINPNFLSDFSDMNIDGSIAYDHIIASDLVQNFISKKYPSRF